MNHQKYIDQAVKLASENVASGGKPFGAVIVKDHTVISTGVNEVLKSGDLTTHAEIQAIRKASKSQGEKVLSGAVLYASGHPCPMCLSAIYLAGIKEVYFASTLDEAKEAGLDVSHIYRELKENWEMQSIPLHQLSSTLKLEPLELWKEGQ
ncbi:MAG TPA: nucleoside deaminase [Balneolaceae bacterium]|nr:nucleoside deaminase [Balneolaceae bacterium]